MTVLVLLRFSDVSSSHREANDSNVEHQMRQRHGG